MLIVTPTNVKVISDASGNNSPNYLVYNNSFGEIRWLDSSNNGFLENLTISKTNISLDDVHLQIRSNSIFMDTNYFSGENINSATQLTFKNVSLSKPIIKKSGADCLSPSCVGSSYNSATHLFTSTVSSFSLYTLVEQCTDGIQNYDETGVDCGGASCVACPSAPSSPPPKSNGGGGGGGGGGSHGGGMSSPISSPISPPSIVPPIVAGENSSVSVDNSTDSSNLSSDAGQVSSANSGNNANSNSDTNSINDASRGPQSQTGQKNADVNADSAGATNSADYPIQTVYPLSSSGDFKILGFDYKWAVIAFLSIVGVILSYMFVSGHDAKVRDLYQVKQYSSGPISKFSGVSARVSSTRAMPIRQNVPPELAEKLKQSIGKYLSVGFSPQQVMKLSVAKGWSPQTIDSMLKDFQRKK